MAAPVRRDAALAEDELLCLSLDLQFSCKLRVGNPISEGAVEIEGVTVEKLDCVRIHVEVTIPGPESLGPGRKSVLTY